MIGIGNPTYTWFDVHIYVLASVTASINYYRSAIQYPEITEDFDWQIRVPVLSIFGTGDKYISVEAAQGSKDFVTDFKEVLIHDASHWVHVEQPNRVNQIMEEGIIE